MTVWLFTGVCVLLVSFWMRSAKRKRLAWLRALNLPGKWELDGQPADKTQQIVRRTLTLGGELDGGRYVARDGDSIQRGNWRLRGHVLGLARTEGDGESGAVAHYDLRLFDKGKIGLDGPGREREVYVKRENNVIPLRVRK